MSVEPGITVVDFVGIPTQDLSAAVVFYRDVLGLTNSVHQPSFAEFETGNVTLSVFDPSQMGMEFNVNRNAVALHVDDIEAARSVLAERGVAFFGDTFDTGVCHMAMFADPDGNTLMLHSRYAPRTRD